MSHRIQIQELEVSTLIGVPDKERQAPQKIRISISFATPDYLKAATSDDLRFSVDYAHVAQRISEICMEKPRRLIETLAEDVAGRLLAEFPISEIEVEIQKFILPNAKSVGVKILRKRSKYLMDGN